MSARVLVVDDVLLNVKLLEAKLAAEYFDVVTARSGPEALGLIREAKPDIVLLDVMMPGMDGFEVCRRIKQDEAVAHIPVVMVTALDQLSDRVAGLEAGADDFLTKPVNDVALFARVRSLVRLKMMTDELRMRESTGSALGVLGDPAQIDDSALEGASVLLLEDRQVSAERLADYLRPYYRVEAASDDERAGMLVRSGDYDLVLVSLDLRQSDGLRFCSSMRSFEATRQTPILALVEEGDTKRLVRALDIGVNDYLVRPVDRNEMLARTRTQLRRKFYADRLRDNLSQSVTLAITDPLTGLHNRRYMMGHLQNLIARASATAKDLSVMMLDIDHFKAVNDVHGHGAGDKVLVEFANRIARNVRGIDLAARIGGEEFVVALPDTDMQTAAAIGGRLRDAVAADPFPVGDGRTLGVTVSIGIATAIPDETCEAVLKRADDALYRAKREGRDRVVLAADP